MNSIKKKLFLQIGSLIVFLVILLLLANTLLLESYYTYTQKNKLIDYYSTINSISSSDYEENLKQFLSIESSSNADILIMDTTGKMLYASNVFLADRKLLDELMDTMNINKVDFAPPIEDHKNLPPNPKIEITKSEKINDKISFIWASDPFITN